MLCPRCKLTNPDSALRCDCGYDFASGTVKQAHFKQELPRIIRNYLIVIVILAVVGALAALGAGDAIRFGIDIVWAALIWWCYRKLVRRKNWARVTLIIMTFPIGLMLL